MYKFAFTYLVKQDKKTWNDLDISLKLLNKNILNKLNCKYKIIIFCEGEPNTKVRNSIDYFLNKKNINIIVQKISLSSYVKRMSKDNYIKYFPHAADCKSVTSLGYRDMCKFFAFDVFLDKKFNDTEYFIRLDTDSFFIHTNKNFIKDLENIKCDYGYIDKTIQYEDKAVSLGFGKCLYDFYSRKLSYSSKRKNFLNFCQEATLRPKIFYTNFEIVKLDWVKSNSHKAIMSHIIKSKGIYNYRWGDALIRYYVVNLLGASKTNLKGCLYKHSGIYDSRNILRRFITKSYSKLRKRLYENIYEKKLSKLDKLFLGFYI